MSDGATQHIEHAQDGAKGRPEAQSSRAQDSTSDQRASSSTIHPDAQPPRELPLFDGLGPGNGSSHTIYNVLSDAGAAITSPSVAPSQTPYISSITSEPLDDYRPPEPVSEPEVSIPTHELQYPVSSVDNGTKDGPWADAWGTATPPNPFITQDAPGLSEVVMGDTPGLGFDWLLGGNNDWWDKRNIDPTPSHPGAGLLPPLLEEETIPHNVHLYSLSIDKVPVSISIPEGTTLSTHTPPSLGEVRGLLDEPNRYHAHPLNGWMYIDIRESLELPEGIRTDRPLPERTTWGSHVNCLAKALEPKWSTSSSDVETHHFHRYNAAYEKVLADGTPLQPQASTSSSDPSLIDTANGQVLSWAPRRCVMDLYVCSRCHVHILVSSDPRIVSGVFPISLVNRFNTERGGNPPIGLTSAAATITAWQLIREIVENVLWSKMIKAINASGTKFLRVIGWNDNVIEIFRLLGFQETAERKLVPPELDPTSEGSSERRKVLLNAWVEISAWLAAERVYSQSAGPAYLGTYVFPATHITATSSKERIQRAIGAHPDQLPHTSPGMFAWEQLTPEQEGLYRLLGLTHASHSAALLKFAYEQQCKTDPIDTPHYLEALDAIANLPSAPESDTIRMNVQIERSQGRWTKSEGKSAERLLGFGPGGELELEWDPKDEDDSSLENAFNWQWQKSASMEAQERDSRRRELKEALRILCEMTGRANAVARGNEAIRVASADPDEAYTRLGTPKETTDEMLIMVYQTRMMDQPGEQMKWDEALRIIAEQRDSDRLRKFLETHTDPGDILAVVPPELPRGIRQLGNTCYLNSLLQYFYTIKDLRHELGLGSFSQGVQTTEEALKQHPVGGRQITPRELGRSRRFVSQLHTLFLQLEYTEDRDVLPEVELAKLALMTSKDEEVEDAATAATSTGSTDTDATLVDGVTNAAATWPAAAPLELSPAPPSGTPPPQPSVLSSPTNSVLGKRPGDTLEKEDRRSPMEIDSAPSLFHSGEASPALSRHASIGSDIEMRDARTGNEDSNDAPIEPTTPLQKTKPLPGPVPPPLPPRKLSQPAVGDMMFGKQNDVSECMDNSLFQIEAALEFEVPTSGEDSKSNLVKRLFYGRKRQRIRHAQEEGKPTPTVSEKEELFAQLLVNVSDTTEGFDLYDGLGGFLDDTVEFEGKKAKMEVDIVELPPILQIQLQRVQFDRTTLQAKKNNAHVKFDETLYMDRFLKDADPAKKARSSSIQAELQKCRDRLALLQQTGVGDYATAMTGLHTILKESMFAEMDDAFRSHLAQEPQLIREEVAAYRARAKELKEELESLWATEKTSEYELCSVFIHRGTSPSWGHYFLYARDLPNNPDKYFKYNDSEVTTVSKDEVLADGTVSTANPYLLVYARKGANVIDTVCRQPQVLEG